MGFRSSTWSQMTLMDIIIGTASKHAPDAPCPAPEQRPTKTATRFIDATLPIRSGVSSHPSSEVMTREMPAMASIMDTVPNWRNATSDNPPLTMSGP